MTATATATAGSGSGTADGYTFLTDFGVRVPQRRPTIRYCVDWSEQRHHLAGALGRGMLDRVTELGWLQRANGTRAVRLTGTGKTGLAKTFGLQEPASTSGSAASFQVNRAVVQNTCRRLCRVHLPLPSASRQPLAK